MKAKTNNGTASRPKQSARGSLADPDVKAAKPSRNPAAMELSINPGETMSQQAGRVTVAPAFINTAAVQMYQHGLMGKEADLMATIGAVSDMVDRVKGGDLSDMEAMLVAQATALQTIFASMVRRAQGQQAQRNLEAFVHLGLKAQAQSRATISALVDLKYPRQATFIKQANMSNGPQQVNNGALAHGGNPQLPQNELLRVDDGTSMDTGRTIAPGRANPLLATLEPIDRPHVIPGQSTGGRKRVQGRSAGKAARAGGSSQ